MNHVQRVLLVLVMAGLVLFGVSVMLAEKAERYQEQWEKMQTERFLEKICRKGSCSYEEFQLYYAALNYKGISTEIRLEEYRKEQTGMGEACYYLISWEELLPCLEEERSCYFEEGSVIKVSLTVNGRNRIRKEQYYDVMIWKE